VEQIRKALEKAYAERSQTPASSVVSLPEPEPVVAALAVPVVGVAALQAVSGRVPGDERAMLDLAPWPAERVADTTAGFSAPVRETARLNIDSHERAEQQQLVPDRPQAVRPLIPRILEIARDGSTAVGRDEAVDHDTVSARLATDKVQDAGAEGSPYCRESERLAAPADAAAAAVGTADSASPAVGAEDLEMGPVAAADVARPPAVVGVREPMPARVAAIEAAARSDDANVARSPSGGPEAGENRRTLSPLARSTPFDLDPQILECNRVLAPDASGPAAAAFRLLRTQVLMRMRERGWQTIGIASARSADGKTTVAANLAITIAADPRHTALLVDLDLRRPGVRTLFGLSPSIGVAEVLAGLAPAAAAFTHPTSIDRLRLLPARVAVQHSSSVAAGAQCRALVSELRNRYPDRIVIFDMPPVLEADDAVTLSALFDCLLFVVAEGRTAREDLARALALVKNTPVVGTVLNQSIEAVHSEAYG
jgi:protein-tyrosine kinase